MSLKTKFPRVSLNDNCKYTPLKTKFLRMPASLEYMSMKKECPRIKTGHS